MPRFAFKKLFKNQQRQADGDVSDLVPLCILRLTSPPLMHRIVNLDHEAEDAEGSAPVQDSLQARREGITCIQSSFDPRLTPTQIAEPMQDITVAGANTDDASTTTDGYAFSYKWSKGFRSAISRHFTEEQAGVEVVCQADEDQTDSAVAQSAPAESACESSAIQARPVERLAQTSSSTVVSTNTGEAGHYDDLPRTYKVHLTVAKGGHYFVSNGRARNAVQSIIETNRAEVKTESAMRLHAKGQQFRRSKRNVLKRQGRIQSVHAKQIAALKAKHAEEMEKVRAGAQFETAAQTNAHDLQLVKRRPEVAGSSSMPNASKTVDISEDTITEVIRDDKTAPELCCKKMLAPSSQADEVDEIVLDSITPEELTNLREELRTTRLQNKVLLGASELTGTFDHRMKLSDALCRIAALKSQRRADLQWLEEFVSKTTAHEQLKEAARKIAYLEEKVLRAIELVEKQNADLNDVEDANGKVHPGLRSMAARVNDVVEHTVDERGRKSKTAYLGMASRLAAVEAVFSQDYDKVHSEAEKAHRESLKNLNQRDEMIASVRDASNALLDAVALKPSKRERDVAAEAAEEWMASQLAAIKTQFDEIEDEVAKSKAWLDSLESLDNAMQTIVEDSLAPRVWETKVLAKQEAREEFEKMARHREQTDAESKRVQDELRARANQRPAFSSGFDAAFADHSSLFGTSNNSGGVSNPFATPQASSFVPGKGPASLSPDQANPFGKTSSTFGSDQVTGQNNPFSTSSNADTAPSAPFTFGAQSSAQPPAFTFGANSPAPTTTNDRFSGKTSSTLGASSTSTPRQKPFNRTDAAMESSPLAPNSAATTATAAAYRDSPLSKATAQSSPPTSPPSNEDAYAEPRHQDFCPEFRASLLGQNRASSKSGSMTSTSFSGDRGTGYSFKHSGEPEDVDMGGV